MTQLSEEQQLLQRRIFTVRHVGRGQRQQNKSRD